MKDFQHGVIQTTLEIKVHTQYLTKIAFRHFYLLSRKLNPICTNGLYPACNKQIFLNTEAVIGNMVIKVPKYLFLHTYQ